MRKSSKEQKLTTQLERLPTDPSTLEQAMERARLLLDLERVNEAQALARRWSERLPQDARPVVILARCELFDTADWMRKAPLAQQFLEQAADYAGRDGDYYGLLIGLKGVTVIQGALSTARSTDELFPLLLERMQIFHVLNHEYMRYQPARAAILGFVIDAVEQAFRLKAAQADTAEIQRFIRELAAPAAELAKKYPRELDAYQLALAAAMFEADPIKAFAASRARPPVSLTEDVDFYLVRARQHLGLAALWSNTIEAEQAISFLNEIPPAAPERGAIVSEMRGDAYALMAQLKHDAAAWKSAETSYRDALNHVSDDNKARILNNLGVTLQHLGRSPEALAVWSQVAALPVQAKSWVATLNTIALTDLMGDAAAATYKLKVLADDPDKRFEGEIPLQITLWQLALAKKTGQTPPENLRQNALAEWKRIERDNIPPRLYSGENGIINERSMSLALLASAQSSTYNLRIVMSSAPWWVFPAAFRVQDLMVK